MLKISNLHFPGLKLQNKEVTVVEPHNILLLSLLWGKPASRIQNRRDMACFREN